MTTYQKWSMTEDAKKENEDGGFEMMIIKKIRRSLSGGAAYYFYMRRRLSTAEFLCLFFSPMLAVPAASLISTLMN